MKIEINIKTEKQAYHILKCASKLGVDMVDLQDELALMIKSERYASCLLTGLEHNFKQETISHLISLINEEENAFLILINNKTEAFTEQQSCVLLDKITNLDNIKSLIKKYKIAYQLTGE